MCKIDALDLVTTVERECDSRRIYWVKDKFAVEITVVTHDLSNPRDLMILWKKRGYIKQPLKTHIAVTTYYNNGGDWISRYNCTMQKGADNRYAINFRYLLEWTPENEEFLVSECIKQMLDDTQKSA